MLRLLGTFVFACAVLVPAWAQSTGAIDGTTSDGSGAVIAAARVTLRNVQTDERHTALTNERGQYVFPSVLPGMYELSVEAAGFKKTVRGNVQVDVQQTVRADITLELGSVAETVEVKGEVPLLQPATSSLGQVVDNRKIVDLPLNGRDVYGLVALTPGVTPLGSIGGAPATINSYSYTNFSASGSLGLTSATLVDGVPVDGNRTNSGMFVPSVDAVAEFKVQTNNFSAEFGRTTGGVVNVVMKSGTNIVHGALYEFLRNRAFDANNFFSNRAGQGIPVYTYNVFGGAMGGPLWIPRVHNGKDRTFFFVSYEGFRNHLAVTPLITVPTSLQRQGDFSQTQNANGQTVGIFDPLTTRLLDNGTYTRDAFPGNRIPANRVDPVASKVLPFLPGPNQPGNARTAANNFIGNGPAANSYDQVSARYDENFSSSNRQFGRYSHNGYIRGSGNIFNNLYGGINTANPQGGGGAVPSVIWIDQAAFHHTVTPSPSMLVDFAAGMTRYRLFKQTLSYGHPLTELGFPAKFASEVQQQHFPSFNITNIYVMNGGAGDLYNLTDTGASFVGSVTKIAGRHSIKTGVDFRVMWLNDFETGTITAPGVFNFTPQWTQQNPFAAAANSGVALASFMLGYVASASQVSMSRPALQNYYFSTYVQDDIRLSPKLTLNLGFRYDLETPRTDRFNQQTWFDPNATSPLAGPAGLPNLKGGLVFAGVNGNPRTQTSPDRNNFAPRLGLAYSLNSKTVIRTGYGIFYGPFAPNAANFSNLGFSSTTIMTTTLDGGLTPSDVLSNPFPKGLNQPTGSSQGLATFAGQAVATAYFRNSRVPYAQQWNFDVQRQLPGNTLVEVAYAGSHNLKLQQFWPLNDLNPSNYSLGSQLQQQVPNPFFGLVGVGPLSARTVTRSQLLLPYPQFLGITGANYAGNSNYHSFQLKVERRLTAGLMFLAAYTNSKNIGDVDPIMAFPGDVATVQQNSYNRHLERTVVATDVSQRLVMSFNYEVPFGRGRHFGAHWNRALDLFAGGWQFNSITTFQRGNPFAVRLAAPNVFGGTRPNNNGKSALLDSSERSVTRAFDTTVFSQPAAFSLGTTGRTLPDVRTPGTNNFDLSLFKVIPIHERLKLQFRAEAFNALNHTRFFIQNAAAPTSSFGNALFGQFTTAADPRAIQLALKLTF